MGIRTTDIAGRLGAAPGDLPVLPTYDRGPTEIQVPAGFDINQLLIANGMPLPTRGALWTPPGYGMPDNQYAGPGSSNLFLTQGQYQQTYLGPPAAGWNPVAPPGTPVTSVNASPAGSTKSVAPDAVKAGVPTWLGVSVGIAAVFGLGFIFSNR